jgi:hypothetical protein
VSVLLNFNRVPSLFYKDDKEHYRFLQTKVIALIMFFCLTSIQETALIRVDGMIENAKELWLHTIVKEKGTTLSPVPVPFIPNDSFICPASTVLNLLHMTKEKHGVKSRLFVDWDMGTPLVVNKARYLLKNLLSDLGFSEDKTPYSFKYVSMSYLVNQNVQMESIKVAPRYVTGSKMVRDHYAISAAQMPIHKLLAEAVTPTLDTLSSREEHPTPSCKGTVSSISLKEEHLIPSSKGTFSSISSKEEHLIPSSKRTATLVFNKCNVTIAEVIKKEKSEYFLPDYISYPSSEDECGNVTGAKVPKGKKKSSKIMYVTPKAPVLLANNSVTSKVPKIMYVTPKEHVLPTNDHVLLANDSDSDRGLFSSENVSENDTRSSEEALIN